MVTNVSSVIFNTQVNGIQNDGHPCSFKNVMLYFLLENKKYLKGISGEANMIKVALLQAADVLFLSLYNLK